MNSQCRAGCPAYYASVTRLLVQLRGWYLGRVWNPVLQELPVQETKPG